MKQAKQHSIKMLAMFLAILMVLYSVPLTVYANIFDVSEEGTTIVGSQASGEPYELTELREESVKHYRLPDGTSVAIQYDLPVHVRNEDDQWVDIDNTLSGSGSEYVTSSARIKFAKKITGNSALFSLQEKGHKITMHLNGARKKTPGVIENQNFDQNTDSNLQKWFDLEHLTSKIRYEDILQDVDLEYIVESNNVKENIIVKKASDAYTYSFTISLNNLVAELQADGSVRISDPSTDAIVYTIPKGYMYDAAGTYSDAISFSLEEHENGTYTFVVTADATWLNSADRIFPVTIDPSVNADPSSVTDLYVNSSTPDSNYSGSTFMFVSSASSAYWKTNALPELPASAYVSEVSLSLFSTITSDTYVGVYQVTSSWDSTLTWNKTQATTSPQGSILSTLIDYHKINGEYVDNNGETISTSRYDFNITNLAKSWYSGTVSNYGVCLKPVSGTSVNTSVSFATINHSIVVRRPCLIVKYRDMKGAESYWSYTTQNGGLAGIGYVNNATGSLLLTKSLLSTTDSLMPFTPTLIYNSGLANKEYEYPNAQTGYRGEYMSRGFKLNIQETLIQKSYIKENGESTDYYIWVDADGTEHSFIPVADNNTSTFIDEDGLNLVLYVTSTACTITDDSKSVRTFLKINSNPGTDIQSSWYLSSITDKNGNTLSFAMDTGLRPIKISLTPNGGRQIDFLTIKYNSNYVPYLIWNPTSKEAIVFRYSTAATGSLSISAKAFLKEIIYAHGNDSVTETDWLNFYNDSSNLTNITIDAKVNYTYSTSGHLTVAKDELSGMEIRYTYSGSKVVTVQEYAGSTAGQKVGFSYYTGYTEVRSSGSDDVYGNTDDLVTRYTFAPDGKVAGCYTTDSAKTQIYGASALEYASTDRIKNNVKSSTVTSGSATNYLLNGDFEKVTSDVATHWTKSSTAIHYYDSLGADNYGKEASFRVAANSTNDLYQYTKLPTGKYTLSMQVLTMDCEDVELYAIAQSLDNASHVYSEEIPINQNYASGQYASFSMNFEVTSTTENFKIIIRAVGKAGAIANESTVAVDKIMLEENISVSNYSLVQLGNFERFSIDSSGTYLANGASFWISDSNNLARGTSSAPFGASGYLSGSITAERYLKQTIYEATTTQLNSFMMGSSQPPPAATYIVSGFAKGTGQVASNNGTFRIRVVVSYYNGTGIEDTEVVYNYDFQKNCKEWQFVCGNFQTEEGGIVRSIVVYLDYANQPGGTVLFDNISIVKSNDGSVTTTEYYGEPKHVQDHYEENDTLMGLVRAVKKGYYTEVYEYNNNRQLTRVANNKGELTDYTYDTIGNVTSEVYYTFTNGQTKIYPYYAENPDNEITKTPKTKTEYSYIRYGLLILSDTFEVEAGSGGVVEKSNTKHIRSSTSYSIALSSKIFGAKTSEYDNLGQRTNYFYDTNTGRLRAIVTVPNDSSEASASGTYYTYDAIGNLKTVTPAKNAVSNSYTPVTNAESVTYNYNAQNRLETIVTESTTYSFEYDVFGNTDSVSVGTRELASYDYNAYNGKLNTIHYGNNFSVRYVYDTLDNLSEVWYNSNGTEQKVYTYTYTEQGQVYRFDNLLTGKSIIYRYDAAGKLLSFVEYDTETMTNEFSSSVTYDAEGRPDNLYFEFDYIFSTGAAFYSAWHDYSYRSDGALSAYHLTTGASGTSIGYTYDSYNRLTKKSYSLSGENDGSFSLNEQYTFKEVEDDINDITQTSSQIATFSTKVGSYATTTYTYTYDTKGNITKISLNNGTEYRYVYDDLSQLIREDNSVLNKTYVYTYDNAGNITSKKEYALTAAGTTPTSPTATYTYGYGDASWGDLLTSYRGQSITYDAIGNPLSYYNGSNYTFTWKNGRSLASTVKGTTSVIYDYNDEGIRTSKKVNGVEHQYWLSGDQIIAETWGNLMLVYLYDAEGSPIGMQFRSKTYAEGVFATYWFEKNLQGDIVAIYNASGTKLVSYTYDAWGNCTKIFGSHATAELNPFRYRGYYYDTETGLYYLNSRYYDPITGRFLNADALLPGITGGLFGYNLFSYCFNSPICFSDSEGQWPEEAAQAEDANQSNQSEVVENHRLIVGGWIDNNKLAIFVVPQRSLQKASTTTIKNIYTCFTAVISPEDGFSSFYQFKKAYGSAGEGYEWHHIVEQSQMIKSGFSSYMIHNPANMVRIPAAVHHKVSGYYSSKPDGPGTLRVRDKLSMMTYEEQYEFGLQVLRLYDCLN